ncbi:hypothetical protein CRG98_044493, partial [Punica granatum]
CKRHERGGSANLRCRKVSSHGLANPARLQEARARWLGELAVQESKLARVSKPSKVAEKKSSTGCKRHERGGSANLRCRKVSSHGLANPARLQEARARWLGELAVQESKLARVSKPSKVAEKKSSTGCKRHERGGSANLRCRKVSSHGLANPARLQEARARWLGELAVQESKLARVSKPSKTRQGCRKVNSHGLANPARLQEARARWLGELAVQESCKRHERGGSANLRCRKVSSHGLANPARLQKRNLARVSRPGKVARKVSSHGLADPARLQKSKLARVNRPGKIARKVSSHGLAEPARLQEERARWLGELAVLESNLARVCRPGKVVEK